MATIKDVAHTAGVSIASVSNYLTGAKNVTGVTSRKIQEAIRIHNYKTNTVASNLKRNKTMTVGLIVTQIDSVFFPQVISGVQKAIEPAGYNLVLYVSKLNQALEKKYVDMLTASCVDGIIVDSIVDDSDTEYFDKLANLHTRGKRIPVVSVERNLADYGIESVVIDNVLGGQIATNHLLNSGCCAIAHISGPIAIQWATERTTGYLNALRQAGGAPDSTYIRYGDFTPIGGYVQTKYFLINALTFDGLFAANDLMAIGAVKALNEHGLRVPDDVKVMGFDNIFISSLLTPSLTTVNVSKQRLGEDAANRLIAAIGEPEHPRAAQAVILPINLIERASTNPGAASGWELFY